MYVLRAHNPAERDRWFKSRFGKMGVRTAMCGKITRQSRWNLRPAVRVRQYRTKPRKIEEGVETEWRASRSPGLRYSPTLTETLVRSHKPKVVSSNLTPATI